MQAIVKKQKITRYASLPGAKTKITFNMAGLTPLVFMRLRNAFEDGICPYGYHSNVTRVVNLLLEEYEGPFVFMDEYGAWFYHASGLQAYLLLDYVRNDPSAINILRTAESLDGKARLPDFFEKQKHILKDLRESEHISVYGEHRQVILRWIKEGITDWFDSHPKLREERCKFFERAVQKNWTFVHG